jgi:hypothetical protein
MWRSGNQFPTAAIALMCAIQYQTEHYDRQQSADQQNLYEQHYQYLTDHGSLFGRGDKRPKQP